MEGRLRHRVLAAIVASGVAGATAVAPPNAPAAVAGPLDVHGTTDASGATVVVVAPGEAAGSGGGRGTGGGGGGGCAHRYVPADVAFPDPSGEIVSVPPLFLGPAPSPEHRAYDVYCGAEYLTTVWALPSAVLGATSERVARELLARVEFPPVTIHANPGRGLTGLETWFWVDGWDGAPVSVSRAAAGITIDIEVHRGDVGWDFGDGTTTAGGFGTSYPGRSDIVHVYERAGTYTIALTVDYRPRYRVNGGPWVELDTASRETARTYSVREVRSALTR